jgi:hypothetical protein
MLFLLFSSRWKDAADVVGFIVVIHHHPSWHDAQQAVCPTERRLRGFVFVAGGSGKIDIGYVYTSCIFHRAPCVSSSVGRRRPSPDFMYIYEVFSINPSFLVVALNFVLATLSSFVVSFYNKTPPQRRSHSRVFTPPSPARGGGGAQFCYPRGAGPDLVEGREVVSRLSVPILGLPSGNAFGPITPTDPPLHGH